MDLKKISGSVSDGKCTREVILREGVTAQLRLEGGESCTMLERMLGG